jgi:hypothetical protein
MDHDVRLTERGLRVLRFMIEQPRASRSGAEIAKVQDWLGDAVPVACKV